MWDKSRKFTSDFFMLTLLLSLPAIPRHGINISELEIKSFRRGAVETFVVVVVTQCRSVAVRQPVDPIFKGQAALLEMGWTACHETSVNSY